MESGKTRSGFANETDGNGPTGLEYTRLVPKLYKQLLKNRACFQALWESCSPGRKWTWWGRFGHLFCSNGKAGFDRLSTFPGGLGPVSADNSLPEGEILTIMQNRPNFGQKNSPVQQAVVVAPAVWNRFWKKDDCTAVYQNWCGFQPRPGVFVDIVFLA